jgi:hypothetical protein
MSELREQLKNEVERILEEKLPEPNEPIRLETDGVFDSAGYPMPGEFIDNPMAALMQPLIQYFESIKPPMAFTTPPKTEHKVRVFRFNDRTLPGVVEAEMQELFDDGYCCHMPTVVGDFVIMDFSRRKEVEENEREQ